MKPVLHTSTRLSDVAKKAAELLHVEFHESVALGDYPSIKCNIHNKQKIYHLPFDQLYDRAHVTRAGEQYCYTVKEAEELGFRRAWKWRGPQQQDAA